MGCNQWHEQVALPPPSLHTYGFQGFASGQVTEGKKLKPGLQMGLCDVLVPEESGQL